MKTFGVILVIGALIFFLLGYSPSDLFYMVPSGGGSSVQPKSRRAASTEETQTAAPAPVQHSTGNANDGSLENRWSTPAKP